MIPELSLVRYDKHNVLSLSFLRTRYSTGMQLFQNGETAAVTEGFPIMMTILGYFLLSRAVAETGDTTPLDVFIIVMAILVSIPPQWILRQYHGRGGFSPADTFVRNNRVQFLALSMIGNSQVSSIRRRSFRGYRLLRWSAGTCCECHQR